MEKSKIRNAIGERIKGLRTENNLTQSKFAKMAGVSQGTLASIESGTRGYSVDTLDRVIRALGVTYTGFYMGIDGAEYLLENSDQSR